MHRGIAFALGIAALIGASAAHAVEIDWGVADRFRLLRAEAPPSTIVRDPGPSVQDNFLARLAAAPASTDPRMPEAGPYEVIRAFLGENGVGRGPLAGKRPYEATRWGGAGPGPRQAPSAARRYDADYLYPDRYTVRLRIPGGRAIDQCRWSLGSAAPAWAGPCSEAVLAPVSARADHRGGAPTEIRVAVVRNGAAVDSGAVTVAFADWLIVGLGDSFAAGEGNPDRPQSWLSIDPTTGQASDAAFQTAVRAFWQEKNADPYERWWRNSQVLKTLTPAQWWDPICHRSLYAQQVVAAYLLSAQRPREAVTFASFACSGAEVLDGVLAPQTSPPGVADFGWPEGKTRTRAQVEDALAMLCRNALAPGLKREDLVGLASRLQLGKAEIENVARSATITELRCADGRPTRAVDAVLLAIGGNDIGFGGAVKNALFPVQASDPFGQNVLSVVRDLLQVTPTYLAHRRIVHNLPALYPEVKSALRAGLAPDATPVIHSTYPNPLEDQGDLRTAAPPGVRSFCEGPDDNRLFNAMHGVFPDEKVAPSRRWRLEVTAAEGREVYDGLFTPLNMAVRGNAQPGWSIVEYGQAFDRRGWCAGTLEERTRYDFPALGPDQKWTSFDPAQWDPYAPRLRLFRTANDVVLTQVGSDKKVLLKSLANRSFYATSGMFHPTAQAHTIMGLKVADHLARQLPPRPQ